MTRHRHCHGVAPSMVEASSSVSGISLMKLVSTQTQNGRVKIM